MKKIKIELLSSRYFIRALTKDDIPLVYRLCKTNPQYYKSHSLSLDEELIVEDMTLCPPGKSSDDKYYVGYFDGDKRLIAILDLIDGYPTEDTAYIGFFMTDANSGGRGIGSDIITELCGYLSKTGFRSIRLAYGKSNPQSSGFWQKNQFKTVKEVDHAKYGRVIVAERILTDRSV